MSALATVALCGTGALLYGLVAVYVYLRVYWYLDQKPGYDHEIGAFCAAVLLPFGLAYLFLARFMSLDRRGGLAPRSVRREQKVKDQAKEIERLERELGIRS